MQRALREFFEDRCHVISAAIAYYTLFSLFPLAILVVGGFALVVGEGEARHAVIDFLLDNLPLRPGEGRRDLRELLQNVTGNVTAFGILGALGLVFSASGLMGALREGVNAAFDTEDRRSTLRGKLLDVLLVLGAGLVVCGSLALTIAAHLMGLPAGGLLGWALPIALAFGLSMFLYRILPGSREPRLADLWPGALVAALGYEAVKEGFALYLDNFGRFGAVYGSIGAVAALLMFAFIAANLFLLGAEIASEWPAVRDGQSCPLELGGSTHGSEDPRAGHSKTMTGTILCGVERSAASARASGFAVLLARQLGAELVSAHVQRPRRLFSRGRRLRPPPGPRVQIGSGDPVDELVRIAGAFDSQLLVIGSRGRLEVGRALLGSVSSGLMLNSPCPLVLVPPGAEVPRDEAQLSSAVCGVEGSDRDVDILRLGADLVARLGGTLHAVHAFEPWPIVGPAPSAALPARELREAAEHTLERSLRAADVAARGEAVARPAAVALEEYARREGAALIVVGSQGHGRLGSVVLGSLVMQLTATAERPLVVLPAVARLAAGSGHYEVAGHVSARG